MNEQEKQEQQGQSQPPSQNSEQQSDQSPKTHSESPVAEDRAVGSPEHKDPGGSDDIETGEGTGARGGEYS